VFVNSLISPSRGRGGTTNVAAVRQALGQHVREHTNISGRGVRIATLPGVTSGEVKCKKNQIDLDSKSQPRLKSESWYAVKPEFHYADFPLTSPLRHQRCSWKMSRESVMLLALRAMVEVCVLPAHFR